MMLNNISQVHKIIRSACQLLEEKEQVKLETNLSEEFEEVIFYGKKVFIIIDYKNKTWLLNGREIKKDNEEIIKDIILYLRWLEIGRIYQNKMQKR